MCFPLSQIKSNCEIISISEEQQSGRKAKKPLRNKKNTVLYVLPNCIYTCLYCTYISIYIYTIIRKHGFCLRLCWGFISSEIFRQTKTQAEH